MNRDQLRDVQRPLKEQYREAPAAAVITLHADGALGSGVTCSVETGRAMVEAGLHPSTGGSGANACSGDLLLQALVACAGVTLQAVATNRGMLVEGTVRAEGDLDVRGTLGVSDEAPVGFREIRLTFDLTTDTSDADVATLIQTTEKYCVVLQTIVGGPIVRVSRA